jgi:hypothetical protein
MIGTKKDMPMRRECVEESFGEAVAKRRYTYLRERLHVMPGLSTHFTRQHMIRMSTHLLPEVIEPSGFVNYSMYAVQQLGVLKPNIINQVRFPADVFQKLD